MVVGAATSRLTAFVLWAADEKAIDSVLVAFGRRLLRGRATDKTAPHSESFAFVSCVEDGAVCPHLCRDESSETPFLAANGSESGEALVGLLCGLW